MNVRARTSMLTFVAATLATITLIVAPVSAKEKTNKHTKHATTTSAAAVASLLGSVPEAAPAAKPGRQDSKPGVAWKTVGGTVKNIQGETYMVEDYDGNQMKVRIGQGTKHLRGNKRVGDSIRAEITHGGFANSIQ